METRRRRTPKALSLKDIRGHVAAVEVDTTHANQGIAGPFWTSRVQAPRRILIRVLERGVTFFRLWGGGGFELVHDLGPFRGGGFLMTTVPCLAVLFKMVTVASARSLLIRGSLWLLLPRFLQVHGNCWKCWSNQRIHGKCWVYQHFQQCP